VYGNAPLHEQLPEAFEELVRVYASILDDAVEEREYRVYHQIRDRIRRLADELGFLRAGPRDVVEVHTSAMRSRASEIGKRRLEAYLAEGRLIVVELMGLLVSFYRRYSLAARPVRVKERGTHIRQGGESNE
jgi:hypothetical protein